jgi:hypothetical protein
MHDKKIILWQELAKVTTQLAKSEIGIRQIALQKH